MQIPFFSSYFPMIEALPFAISFKHKQRVSFLASEYCNLDTKNLNLLQVCGLIHKINFSNIVYFKILPTYYVLSNFVSHFTGY